MQFKKIKIQKLKIFETSTLASMKFFRKLHFLIKGEGNAI